MGVRAITFDFWGTLFRDTNADKRHDVRLQAFLRATDVPEEAAIAAFRQTYNAFHTCHREEQRTMTPRDAVRMLGEQLGLTMKPHVAEQLAITFAMAILKHPPEMIEGALDAVRAAAAHGPVGLISDSGISPGASLSMLLSQHGFLDYISAKVYSDEVGVAKPQPAMFETAARQLRVQPDELLHIGDLEPTDILGVQRIGGVAALFAGHNTRYLERTRAQYVFTDWQQFIDALPKLTG